MSIDRRIKVLERSSKAKQHDHRLMGSAVLTVLRAKHAPCSVTPEALLQAYAVMGLQQPLSPKYQKILVATERAGRAAQAAPTMTA